MILTASTIIRERGEPTQHPPLPSQPFQIDGRKDLVYSSSSFLSVLCKVSMIGFFSAKLNQTVIKLFQICTKFFWLNTLTMQDVDSNINYLAQFVVKIPLTPCFELPNKKMPDMNNILVPCFSLMCVNILI